MSPGEDNKAIVKTLVNEKKPVSFLHTNHV